MTFVVRTKWAIIVNPLKTSGAVKEHTLHKWDLKFVYWDWHCFTLGSINSEFVCSQRYIFLNLKKGFSCDFDVYVNFLKEFCYTCIWQHILAELVAWIFSTDFQKVVLKFSIKKLDWVITFDKYSICHSPEVFKVKYKNCMESRYTHCEMIYYKY